MNVDYVEEIMTNKERFQEYLEKYIGILLCYIDELYDDFVEYYDLSYVLEDIECEEIELSDAYEYGSEEYEYYKKSEAREEMYNQIENILSDAEDAFNDSIEAFMDSFHEALESFDEGMECAFDGIDSICEICMEDIIESEEDREAFTVYCKKQLENVFSIIRTKREEIQQLQSNCDDVVDNYFEKNMDSVKTYVKLCDIEDDEDDEDTVYAYILDDALEQIQEDTNDLLENVPQIIADEYKNQLVIIFKELRLGVKEELKEYLDSPVVMESYKEDGGETYSSFNSDNDYYDEYESISGKRRSTFLEKLEAEAVGTAWFISGFFQ